ncbi:uncharacterized protein [Nicotiana sylvestris]|uniref:uncharacterized protein n=1 Tax=Nicotiana sylvestris TaxID=4096 RepID=UPI00388CD602
MSAPPRNWEGQSTDRPPLFNGHYYSWWKNRMRDQIIGEDYQLWDIVTDSTLATMKKNGEGVDVPKIRVDCNAEDLRKWGKMLKRRNGLVIIEKYKVEKILTRVLPVTWESKITVTQESKNIVTLKLDELIGNLTAYELRRQTMKMDAPKKERSLAFRITEGADLEEDEMTMITKDFKKYLMKGKGPSRSGSYSKLRVPEKQTNEGCYKCGKTDRHIKNCPQWEIEWKKEIAERRNMKKEQDLNNEKVQLSKECVILKAKCKNLELRASESESKNAELKNQVHELDITILELRSESLKLKLRTGKKKTDHAQLTLEENVGKMKDELYKRDEQIRVLKQDLNKVKYELYRTCKWNRSSDALSGLHEHHSRNKRGLGYGTP